MTATQLLNARRTDWEKLSALLDRAQKGIYALSPTEIEEMTTLYRTATADLSLAKRDFPRHQVTTYLNQLVSRGHTVIYQDKPLALGRVRHFFLASFPRTFRANWRFMLVSAVLFGLPALLAGLIVYAQPDTASVLMPVQYQQLIPQIEDQDLWVDIPLDQRPYASSFIMTNNIRVSFLAFAGGVTAGLLTTAVLILNGLMLGSLTGFTAVHDVGFELWTFIIGHGVIELTTIIISGGSGLLIGWAIIHPGLHRRRDAIVTAARQALILVVGCLPLFIIAGLIEGFISPNESLSWPIKWGVGIGSGILLFTYLLRAGRHQE